MSTTKDHKHCYCVTNMIDQPTCCICGKIVHQSEIYDRLDFFLMWEKMGHDKRVALEREKEREQQKHD